MQMVSPEKRFKVGGCSASVFDNEIATATGKAVVKTVQLDRVYKDKSGAFQYTKVLQQKDLPKAILALQKAYEYLTCPPDPTPRNDSRN